MPKPPVPAHVPGTGVNIQPSRAQPGDKIIVNGQIAVHGIAIMSVREGLEFETKKLPAIPRRSTV